MQSGLEPWCTKNETCVPSASGLQAMSFLGSASQELCGLGGTQHLAKLRDRQDEQPCRAGLACRLRV